MAYETQVITEFKRTKIHNVTQNNQPAPNKQEIINGTSTQSVGQKVHLDTTPSLSGKDYPGGSEEVRSWVKEDGTSPIIEWRWYVDGKEASNSAQMPDPFHLGSYEDDGGCTPTLKLTEQVGPGRHEVRAQPFVHGQYNGGVGVVGPAVIWYCD